MSKVVLISPSLNELPIYETLTWDDYQTFCTDVLSQVPGVVDSREYLLQGNKQEGIDVYATRRDSDKKIVIQCKLKEYLPPQDVDDLITEFLNGSFVSEVNEFILCTSYDLS